MPLVHAWPCQPASTRTGLRRGPGPPVTAPGPGAAVTLRASRGSPQCEQAGTADTTCPHAVCLISTLGPAGLAHRSPHCRMAVITCHRSRPLGVSRYSERGG